MYSDCYETPTFGKPCEMNGGEEEKKKIGSYQSMFVHITSIYKPVDYT